VDGKTKGFIKTEVFRAEELVGVDGRCVRYGWIGRRKDGYKGGVKGPLLMKQKKRGNFAK
jgi:hypothetical protein